MTLFFFLSVTFQTLTMPSSPPLTMMSLVDALAMEVTPCWWAS